MTFKPVDAKTVLDLLELPASSVLPLALSQQHLNGVNHRLSMKTKLTVGAVERICRVVNGYLEGKYTTHATNHSVIGIIAADNAHRAQNVTTHSTLPTPSANTDMLPQAVIDLLQIPARGVPAANRPEYLGDLRARLQMCTCLLLESVQQIRDLVLAHIEGKTTREELMHAVSIIVALDNDARHFRSGERAKRPSVDLQEVWKELALPESCDGIASTEEEYLRDARTRLETQNLLLPYSIQQIQDVVGCFLQKTVSWEGVRQEVARIVVADNKMAELTQKTVKVHDDDDDGESPTYFFEGKFLTEKERGQAGSVADLIARSNHASLGYTTLDLVFTLTPLIRENISGAQFWYTGSCPIRLLQRPNATSKIGDAAAKEGCKTYFDGPRAKNPGAVGLWEHAYLYIAAQTAAMAAILVAQSKKWEFDNATLMSIVEKTLGTNLCTQLIPDFHLSSRRLQIEHINAIATRATNVALRAFMDAGIPQVLEKYRAGSIPMETLITCLNTMHVQAPLDLSGLHLDGFKFSPDRENTPKMPMTATLQKTKLVNCQLWLSHGTSYQGLDATSTTFWGVVEKPIHDATLTHCTFHGVIFRSPVVASTFQACRFVQCDLSGLDTRACPGLLIGSTFERCLMPLPQNLDNASAAYLRMAGYVLDRGYSW